MNPLDQNLVDRCVTAWEAWEPYAAKRDGQDYPAPDSLSVNSILRREGVTWARDRALYLRYERAIRKRAARQERPKILSEADRSTTCPKCGRDDFPDFRARRIHESKTCSAETERQLRRIANRYEAGDDVTQIMRQEGISSQTLYRAVDAHGVDRRYAKHRRSA